MPSSRPGHNDIEAMRRRTDVIANARKTFGIEPLDQVIRAAVKHAWVATAHDAMLCAKCLGVSKSTFYRYLKRYNLDRWA